MAVAAAARPRRRGPRRRALRHPARPPAGPRREHHAQPGQGGGHRARPHGLPRHGRPRRRPASSLPSSWPTAASSRRRLLEQVPMVNLHFSLLPRWRGAAPVERAILAGDRETGVCLMKVEEGLDTGPVYAVRAVPLDDDVTLGGAPAAAGRAWRARCWSTRWPTGSPACPSPNPSEGEVDHGGQDHQGGSPPRLDERRPSSSGASCASAGPGRRSAASG